MSTTILRVVIADDEPLARLRLRRMLESISEIEILAEAATGRETLEQVEHHEPDLLLLDINMPDISGLRVLAAMDDPPAVVFSTAYQEHAVEAFDLDAVDYLLKPYSAQRLARAIERARDRITPPPSLVRAAARIPVDDGRSVKLLDPAEVSIVRIESGVVFLYHCSGEKHTTPESLKDIETRLSGETFLRASRQAIININEVVSMEPTGDGALLLRLRGGLHETISRRRARHFRDRLQRNG